MKFKKNKIIASALATMCAAFGFYTSVAKVSRSNTSLKPIFDATREADASRPVVLSNNITVTNLGSNLGYFKNNGTTHTIPKKETSNFGFRQPVYSYHHGAAPPSTGGTNYQFAGIDGDRRALYIMEADTGYGYYSHNDYYIRSAAIDNIKSGKLTGNVTGTTALVNSWRKILSNSGVGRTSQDVRVSLSPTSLSFSRNGNYFESNWVNINIDNNNDVLPAFKAALSSSKVNLSGAPNGTEVIRDNGTVASNGNIGSDKRFWIRIPATAIPSTAHINASVTSTFSVGQVSKYMPTYSGDSNKQPVAVRTNKSHTINSSTTGTATIVGGGNLEVTKKGDDGKLLSGASFQLRSGNTPITGVQTTDSNGKTVFNSIPYGNYTLVETAAPWGYHASANTTVTVPAGSTGRVTVVNRRAKGDFKVIKKDDSGKLLQGAKFTLNTGNNVVAGPIETNSNGEAIFRDIPIGGYSLVETSAPEGYLIDPNQNWKIIEVEYGKVAQKVVSNKLIRGNIKVTKVDYLDANRKLSGAEFKLYNSSNQLVATATTDTSGVAMFRNIPYGNYTVKESKPPAGYNLSTEVKSFKVSNDGSTYEGTIKNTRSRDYAVSAYNIKDSSSKIVGTLRKGASYTFNTKLTNSYVNLTLQNETPVDNGKITSMKYAIAVHDGSQNQSVSSITTSNLKGKIISSGTRNNISIKDSSSVWQSISLAIPNDDSLSEIVFVVEIQASDDVNINNNKLVVKMPIINPRKDKITITNMDIYPPGSGEAIVGNDINVKLNISANSLKSYNVNSRIMIEGPQGFNTKTINKVAYGVSMENDGSVYFKFKPTIAGKYTITPLAEIDGSTSSVSPKSITVVDPKHPKDYSETTKRTNSQYNTKTPIKTYIKVSKRDLDVLKVRKCDKPCEEDTNGSKVCPGHEYWDWSGWYDAFVPMKTTMMSNIKESYNIKSIKFRSKYTESNAVKAPQLIDEEGYIEILNQKASKYARVKAGYGFDVKVETEYKNNLPEVFNTAYINNSMPVDTTWSNYKLKTHPESKMPYVYKDSKGKTVDQQVSSYTGAVSVAVPSMSDLIIENPIQLYMKLPQESNEYYYVDEGYNTKFNDDKIKQNLVLIKDLSSVSINDKIYAHVMNFEFKKNGPSNIKKRGYNLNKNVKNGLGEISFYNRYSGFGLNNNTRLHDKKTFNVDVYGGLYDDLKNTDS